MKTKCPGCGGNISYNPITQSLSCDYCGNTFRIHNAKYSGIKHAYSRESKLEQLNTNSYQCNSCGSMLSAATNNVISRCPNCGSKDIKTRIGTRCVPDAILPLSITKKQATTNFQKFINYGYFRPNNFKRMARLGKLSVAYTPAFIFEATAQTFYSGIGVEKVLNDDKQWVDSFHEFSGSQKNSYKDKMFSANKTIATYILENLKPWDYNNLRVYSDDYLFGIAGSNVSIDLHSAYDQFKRYIDNREESMVKMNHQYFKYDKLSINTIICDPKYNYVYLPIYANYCEYNGKHYACYVNGSTGKVYGKSPKSFWKIFGLVMGILGGIAAIVAGGLLLAGII